MAIDTLSLDADSDKPFYVYLYRDPRQGRENRPIYIGKGTAALRRAFVHWKRTAGNPILARILAKIRRASLSPPIEIVAWFDREEDAFNLERVLIAKFGRLNIGTGTLANMTDGGEGISGPSATVRKARGARLKTIRAIQENDPAFRAMCFINLAKGRGSSDPTLNRKRAKSLRAVSAAIAADPERSTKQSEQRSASRKASWKNPEIRERYIASHRGSDELKRASLKAHYANSPDARDAKRALLTSADVKAKCEAGKARSRLDPEKQPMWAAKRAAMLAGNKLAWADPVKRAARLASMKAARERKKIGA